MFARCIRRLAEKAGANLLMEYNSLYALCLSL
jgi:hypothetical protein